MYDFSLHEQKRHGTAEFPAQYYYVDKEHPQYHMPFHWHREWEIILILQGELALHVDEREYTACEGDVFLLQGGSLHGGAPKEAQDCVYECFVFDLHGLFREVNAVKKYLRPIYRSLLLPEVYFPAKDERIFPIVKELMNAFRPGITHASCLSLIIEGDLHELITLSCISKLFTVILQNELVSPSPAPSQSHSRKVDQLKTVLEYIETHFSSHLSLRELSDVAGMSPKYFCRFFRSVTQQTPMDYVNYYRIEQAAAMLCTDNLSVTSVGLECGFEDSSYFVKVFKKYKGMTPRQYRLANED